MQKSYNMIFTIMRKTADLTDAQPTVIDCKPQNVIPRKPVSS